MGEYNCKTSIVALGIKTHCKCEQNWTPHILSGFMFLRKAWHKNTLPFVSRAVHSALQTGEIGLKITMF